MTDDCLVDGRPGLAVPADDRGLAYGDGVFRTLRLHHGQPIAWPFQWQQLDGDCRKLGIETPPQQDLLADLATVGANHDSAVAKIIVTRGSGPRGYASTPGLAPRRVVSAHEYHAVAGLTSLELDYSDVLLPHQPRLAGVKHLNRLEQVMARNECRQPGATDAVMCDMFQRIISTTMRNLFFVDAEDRWWTPDLTRTGVAGATRKRLLYSRNTRSHHVNVADITRKSLISFVGALACNSVGNAMAVTRMGDRNFESSLEFASTANALLAETE